MEVDGRSALAKHVSHSRSQEESSQLVEDRADHLQPLAVSLGVVLLPEGLQADRITKVLGQPRAHTSVEKKEWDLGERGFGVAEKGEQRSAEYVIGSRSPESLEALAEDRDHAVGHELALSRIIALEDVQSYRSLANRRIDQHDTVRVPRGNALQQLADEVPLGIDDANADAAVVDVLQRQVQKQRALADSGRAKNVNVLAPVLLTDLHWNFEDVIQARQRTANAGAGSMPWHDSDARRLHRDLGKGEMEQQRQFLRRQHHRRPPWTEALVDCLLEGR